MNENQDHNFAKAKYQTYFYKYCLWLSVCYGIQSEKLVANHQRDQITKPVVVCLAKLKLAQNASNNFQITFNLQLAI